MKLYTVGLRVWVSGHGPGVCKVHGDPVPEKVHHSLTTSKLCQAPFFCGPVEVLKRKKGSGPRAAITKALWLQAGVGAMVRKVEVVAKG